VFSDFRFGCFSYMCRNYEANFDAPARSLSRYLIFVFILIRFLILDFVHAVQFSIL